VFIPNSSVHFQAIQAMTTRVIQRIWILGKTPKGLKVVWTAMCSIWPILPMILTLMKQSMFHFSFSFAILTVRLNKHCSLEPLEAKEYPSEAKEGYNILFTYVSTFPPLLCSCVSYAMLNAPPYAPEVEQILAAFKTIPGVDAFQLTADPIHNDSISHIFD
jgi:hypothetical protein